jgi:hypothetical protein
MASPPLALLGPVLEELGLAHDGDGLALEDLPAGGGGGGGGPPEYPPPPVRGGGKGQVPGRPADQRDVVLLLGGEPRLVGLGEREHDRHALPRAQPSVSTASLCITRWGRWASRGTWLASLPSGPMTWPKCRHCRYSVSVMKPLSGLAQPSARMCSHCAGGGGLRRVR